MEIKKLGENKIRCALSEEEIHGMGYDIDEIIGNTDITQKFMKAVVALVEEKTKISMENISPMVKAELLQDHSMAITFGGESEYNFKSLADTVGQLMSQLAPEKLEQFHQMNDETKKIAMQDFLKQYGELLERDTESKEKEKLFSFLLSLEFSTISDAVSLFKHVLSQEKLPKSSLYKWKDKYYVILDFVGFYKEELKTFAFSVVEFYDGEFGEEARSVFIKEHGTCIVENEAVQMLMQL